MYPIPLTPRASTISRSITLSARGKIAPLDAERQVFEATHAEVGAYLLGIWGLPDPIIEAVAFHHRPVECAPTFAPLTAVHVADALALEHKRQENGESEPERLDMGYLKQLGLAERLPVWEEQSLAQANLLS